MKRPRWSMQQKIAARGLREAKVSAARRRVAQANVLELRSEQERLKAEAAARREGRA